jgi:hypothetical protein
MCFKLAFCLQKVINIYYQLGWFTTIILRRGPEVLLEEFEKDHYLVHPQGSFVSRF